MEFRAFPGKHRVRSTRRYPTVKSSGSGTGKNFRFLCRRFFFRADLAMRGFAINRVTRASSVEFDAFFVKQLVSIKTVRLSVHNCSHCNLCSTPGTMTLSRGHTVTRCGHGPEPGRQRSSVCRIHIKSLIWYDSRMPKQKRRKSKIKKAKRTAIRVEIVPLKHILTKINKGEVIPSKP